MWNSPAVTGTLPPQLWAGFSFTLMGSRAVLVGGVGVVYGDVGVYCFDIDSKVSDCVSDVGEQCVSMLVCCLSDYCNYIVIRTQ